MIQATFVWSHAHASHQQSDSIYNINPSLQLEQALFCSNNLTHVNR